MTSGVSAKSLRHIFAHERYIRSPWVIASLVLTLLFSQSPAVAVTPNSPEVRALIQKGADYLTENFSDTRRGALYVAGLALYKMGQKDHPLVKRALETCFREASGARKLDNYSHGLAIIFLSEAGGSRYRSTIDQYLKVAVSRQKPHGGWGYDYGHEERESGDTSQTQYFALAFWQAHQTGIPVPRESTQKMIDWLTATQDPKGGWGYQGVIGTPEERVSQRPVTDTMTIAAMGSLMIGADLFGMLEQGARDVIPEPTVELPQGVRRAGVAGQSIGPKLSSADIDWPTVYKSMQDGEGNFNSSKDKLSGRYLVYHLYTLERYMSFMEFRDGVEIAEPEWYQQGYEKLLKTQTSPGVWDAGCGKDADTAFAMLFLLRSTQKSLRARIGEGVMLSGRGLPKDLSRAKIKGGKIVAEIDDVEISGLLSLIEGEDAERLDELVENPTSLKVDSLTTEDLTRLEQVLRNGSPSARVVAANALGKVSDLDFVPALLYALTDPDQRVVLAARDALRFTSRRPDGFGLSDSYKESEQFEVHQRWKRWYLSIRPNARLED